MYCGTNSAMGRPQIHNWPPTANRLLLAASYLPTPTGRLLRAALAPLPTKYWQPTRGRPLQIAYYLMAATNIGHIFLAALAACNRPPTSGRRLLAAYYRPNTAAGLRLAACLLPTAGY